MATASLHARPDRGDYLLLMLLGLTWGGSFLLIKLAVATIPPLTVVAGRIVIGAAVLGLLAWWRGAKLPRDRASWSKLFVMGTLGTMLPFALITWGETRIDSGLASVLQGTAALFTLVVAHFTFADERITLRKVVGLLIGFLGVVVLASRGMGSTAAGPAADLLGQMAIVVASFCYALGGTYSRKAIQNRLEPMAVAAGSMTVAAIITGAIAYLSPAFGGPAPANLAALRPDVLGAVLALGLVNTFGAYLIFYPLVAVLGAARTSMVTYVIPVVGLILGAIFLGEQVDMRLVAGTAMIVGGVGIVNLSIRPLLGSLVAAAKKRAKAPAS